MRSLLSLALIVAGVLSARPAESKVLFPFEGKIDLLHKELSFQVNPGGRNALSLKVAPSSETQYFISLTIDHLSVPFCDVSSVIESPVDVIRDKNGNVQSLAGKFWSKYTLINYKPMEEMSGSFDLSRDAFALNTLSLGKLDAKAVVRLSSPYQMDATMHLSQMEIAEFANFWVKDELIPASGWVAGEVQFIGVPGHIRVRGNLLSEDGLLGKLDYDNLLINFSGLYPQVYLTDSVVTKKDGFTFNVSGIFDLSKTKNFEQQIRDLDKQPVVHQKGGNLEWTVKRFESDQKHGATELKYLKQVEEIPGKPSGEEGGMIGVERSMKF